MYNFKCAKDAYKAANEHWKLGKAPAFPPYVTFELVNTCNFRCLMCVVTYLKRKRKDMDFSVFKKAVDEISHYGSLIRFIGFEEPFLYGRIEEAVRYVKAKNLLLHITTNGSLLNELAIRKIIDAKLDSIIFSFQGLTEEEYCVMRNTTSARYRKVIDNIKLLHRLRKPLRPHIKITTTVTNRDNPADKQKFISRHRPYADEVQVTGFTGFVHIQRLGNKDVWKKLKLARPARLNKVSCFVPHTEMIIRGDGSIHSCCGAFTDDLKIGDVAGAGSLLGAWNSDRMAYVRKELAGGALEKFKDCAVCPIRYGYAGMDNTVSDIREQ